MSIIVKLSLSVFCALCLTSVCSGYDSQTRVSEKLSFRRNSRDVENQACDCGPHSRSCKMKEGEKVCVCKNLFRQVNGICEPFCQKEYECENGAQCVNESCQCLPGTSGPFCESVEECDEMKGILKCGDPKKVFCKFDPKTLKTFCKCRVYEYLYYPPKRTCIECDCDENYGSCSLEDGKKKCHCHENAAPKPQWWVKGETERCYPCRCGKNSRGCYFEEGSGDTICDCKEGTVQRPDDHFWGVKCDVCSCGDHGKCYYRGIFKYCNCTEGYKPFVNFDRTDVHCEECNCGKNGECSFSKQTKICKCNPGYSEREGICVACQCYADDKVVDCYFEGKIQHCLCPQGYTNGTFVCKDIDECNSSRSCPLKTVCINTMGSYDCKCKEGYEASEEESIPEYRTCHDVNECEDEPMCPRNHTVCNNLPGSYKCDCEPGFVPIIDGNPKAKGCETKTRTWTTLVITLSALISICVIGSGILICKKKRHVTRTESVNTILEDLK